jgi:hypothetical protein
MALIREYDLDDPGQEIRDLRYWQSRSVSERLEALEAVRRSWRKLNGEESKQAAGRPKDLEDLRVLRL